MHAKLLLLTLLIIGLFMAGTLPLQSAEITVTTTQDNVEGSLREAITTANANDENDTIILPAGVYYISGATRDDDNINGDLDIDTTHGIAITGDGKYTTVIDGQSLDRVFHIINGTVTISHLTIRGGRCGDSITDGVDGESGGGIYNNGTLYISQAIIMKNHAGDGIWGAVSPWSLDCPSGGGSGGGIYNTGTLTMEDCSIIDNEAGECGNAIDVCKYIPGGGHGGGIYNATTGIMTLNGCYINENRSGRGYAGGWDHDVNNNGGDGGGICNKGTQILTDCSIQSNYAAEGGTGTYGGGHEGRSGRGGGIWCDGQTTLTNCIISGNYTDTYSYYVLDVKEGDGGGIYSRGNLDMESCTISENYTGSGGSGGGIANIDKRLNILNCAISANYTSNASAEVDAGDGGGIYNNSENFTIINSTVSGNVTGSGIDGSYRDGTNGGRGGGIYTDHGGSISATTICNNTTGSEGAAGIDSGAEPGSPGSGGGICSPNSPLNIDNTIVAGNQVPDNARGPDIYGWVYSKGYNLIGNDKDLSFNSSCNHCIIGTDPVLGPLADNGGPTLTHALLPGSPAIDAGNFTTGTSDQRGSTRPVDFPNIHNAGNGTDIGAYEVQLSNIVTPVINLDKTAYRFGADKAGNATSPQTVTISNIGTGTLNWTVNASASWLICTPGLGTGNGQFTVSVSATGLDPGTYTGSITVSDPLAINSPQNIDVTLTVYSEGEENLPFGVMDTPVSGSTVSGSIPVTGWALDNIGIQYVKIYRPPQTGEGGELVYIGDATFVEGARPDVQTTFPNYPGSHKAGWGYMLLTNFLPGQGNGTIVLHAIAVDNEGNSVTLGEKTILCDNANAVNPFGAIDTPLAGGIVSGSRYVNFGWALTPSPSTIPFDGSTITVWVDGQPLGHPVYDNFRIDIATLFPGYNNSQGAVGYYYLDTTLFQNGVHTIAWSVKDNAGNSEGIGSRYFTIRNTGSPAPASQTNASKRIPASSSFAPGELTRIQIDNYSPLSVRTGFDLQVPLKEVYPNENKAIRISVRPLEPLELRFPNRSLIQLIPPHPTGASLDRQEGIFRWLPGLAFSGPHTLSFLVRDSVGRFFKKTVIVQIGKYNLNQDKSKGNL